MSRDSTARPPAADPDAAPYPGTGRPDPTWPGRPLVVLLRDGAFPAIPGVCCWRGAARAAFTAAGARVTEATWQPPARAGATATAHPRGAGPPGAGACPPGAGTAAAGGAGVRAGRLEWLPPRARRPLAVAYRRSRAAVRMLRPPTPPPRRAVPGLDRADVVVAESVRAARAAVAGGAPPRRVWALCLPAERTVSGGRTPFTRLVSDAAGLVGGFLTDGESARDAIERAATGTRPRVLIFPPVAVDRPCPTCAGAEPAGPTGEEVGERVGEPAGQAGQADGTDEVDWSVRQLALWRTSVAADRSAGPARPSLPHSFPAARLLGPAAAWAPPGRTGWAPDGPDGPAGPGLPGEPAEATTAVQEDGARAVLAATLPPVPDRDRTARSVVVSGFDLKFFRELGQRLGDRPDLDLALDEWPGLASPSPATARLVARADVVVAEWARPTAAWLAGRRRPDQLFVVRLHRFELDAGYARRLDIDRVDAVVYVSPPIGRRIVDELGWPRDKLLHIPNFIDVDAVDRPKLPDARFSLGMVGVEWRNKRLDLALDLLAEVRRADPRFHLFVRSVAPWDNRFAWARADEREYAGWCAERITRDPLLRGAVIFDPPGRDMARWYRQVGTVLSMSDIESFHIGLAEGMASGAVPVIRPWGGAEEIYDGRWIHHSLHSAVAAVLENADAAQWARRAALARDQMRRAVDPTAVVTAWADLLHGDLSAARERFASVTTVSTTP